MILFRCTPDPKAAARGRGTTTTGRPNRATVARRGGRSPRSFRTRRSWAVDHAPVVVTIRFIAGQITPAWSDPPTRWRQPKSNLDFGAGGTDPATGRRASRFRRLAAAR